MLCCYYLVGNNMVELRTKKTHLPQQRIVKHLKTNQSRGNAIDVDSVRPERGYPCILEDCEGWNSGRDRGLKRHAISIYGKYT